MALIADSQPEGFSEPRSNACFITALGNFAHQESLFVAISSCVVDSFTTVRSVGLTAWR
jgi:hypothetical protein